jgi:hypothetical protein
MTGGIGTSSDVRLGGRLYKSMTFKLEKGEEKKKERFFTNESCDAITPDLLPIVILISQNILGVSLHGIPVSLIPNNMISYGSTKTKILPIPNLMVLIPTLPPPTAEQMAQAMSANLGEGPTLGGLQFSVGANRYICL